MPLSNDLSVERRCDHDENTTDHLTDEMGTSRERRDECEASDLSYCYSLYTHGSHFLYSPDGDVWTC